MRLPRVPLIVWVSVLAAVAGCAGANRSGGDAAPPAAGPTPAVTSAGVPASPTAAGQPSAAGLAFKVTYGWGVPSRLVRVAHPITVPVAPPPAPPLPYLERVSVGDHPEGAPAYSRISFAFRGTFPEYNLQYVRQVLSEGEGKPIPLPGNSFLRIQFVQAQAHDDAGRSTIKASPPARLGFNNLIGYGFGGDFEGYLTYGLGIQVAPGSDQVLPVRVGESRRPDGTYVVSFDVQRG